MLLSPVFFLFLATLTLGLWFFRSRKADASLWMYATYASLAGLAWTHYLDVSALDVALPKVARDFLLIGVAGLLQSLAVAKRIKVWQAIGGIAVVYTLVYLLPFEDEQDLTASGELATSLVKTTNPLDPTGEYLLEKRYNVAEQDLLDWAEQAGFEIKRAFTMNTQLTDQTLLDEYYVVDVPEGRVIDPATIDATGLVTWVEGNELVAHELPDNAPAPDRLERPLTNDAQADKQWAMEVLDMSDYYALLRELRPRKKARIAILDTGIDAQHEDLADNFFSLNADYDTDPRGHGTHCAGIAAGVTNNSVGIASLAGKPGLVEITSIKVLGAGGSGSQRTIIQGILEAADAGVDVISLSLGGFGNQRKQRAYNQAVSYANRQGAIVVVAAGNSNREATGYSPANAAGVICVAASDQLNLRAMFSNRVGGVQMPLAAPGVNIHSTFPRNQYKMFSGTSMACPFVAGLIGVIRSQRPELDTRAVYQILNETAKATREEEQLGRIVQPGAALRAALDY